MEIFGKQPSAVTFFYINHFWALKNIRNITLEHEINSTVIQLNGNKTMIFNLLKCELVTVNCQSEKNCRLQGMLNVIDIDKSWSFS